MPHVLHVRDFPSADPAAVFSYAADLDCYPDIASSVRSVSTDRSCGGAMVSRWEVNFRNGILRWTEEDEIDAESRQVKFRQIDGDMAEFQGEWTIGSSSEGTRVTFDAYFDLGMPTLAEMLDPVAERALITNVNQLMEAFVTAAASQVVVEGTAPAPVATRLPVEAGVLSEAV